MKIFESNYKIFPFIAIGGFLSFLFGLQHSPSINYWILSVIVYTLMMGFGISVTYHRLLAHRSFKTHSFIKYLGVLFGGFAGTGSAIGWIAIHRKHHRFSDKHGDPHNPTELSLIQMLLLRYNFEFNKWYVKDLLRDKVLIFQHKYYHILLLLPAIVLFSIDFNLGLYGYIIPLWLSVVATSSSLIIEHQYGYRTYDTPDKAKNSFFNSLTVFGEGWHNNHHNNPRSPSFGEKWYEIDIGYWIVKLIKI